MKTNSFLLKIILVIIFIQHISFPQGKDIKLSPKEKKELNTFFSNFSEIFMEPFTKENLSDKALINFGVSHNYRNNLKKCEKGEDPTIVKLKSSFVDDAVNKYFGKKIKTHQSVEDYKFSNGKYTIPEAAGEAYVFSQIENLYDNGNNFYSANINVYSIGSGWSGSPHGTPKEWQKKAADEGMPELTNKMKATIQKVTENGKTRYILIDYFKVK
jgi:hypothetical protein